MKKFLVVSFFVSALFAGLGIACLPGCTSHLVSGENWQTLESVQGQLSEASTAASPRIDAHEANAVQYETNASELDKAAIAYAATNPEAAKVATIGAEQARGAAGQAREAKEEAKVIASLGVACAAPLAIVIKTSPSIPVHAVRVFEAVSGVVLPAAATSTPLGWLAMAGSAMTVLLGGGWGARKIQLGMMAKAALKSVINDPTVGGGVGIDPTDPEQRAQVYRRAGPAAVAHVDALLSQIPAPPAKVPAA